ncbi:MAG: type I secretion system protein LssZ [Legionella sp.]|jgi:hypothetical protein
MDILPKFIHCAFPLIGLLLLLIGIKKQAIYYVISAMWLSIIALIIHFEFSGSQILGSYFDYLNAGIYSLNLIILFISLITVVNHLSTNTPFYRYTSSLLKAFVFIGSIFVMINIWTNAYFIENRMPGTPVMQVALLQKADYCSYKYIFYKVTDDGSVDYLCPNHFGLVPSIGHLAVSPDFITTQLSLPVKKHLLQLQKHKS